MKKVEINELRYVDAGGFVWGDTFTFFEDSPCYGYVSKHKLLICLFSIDSEGAGFFFHIKNLFTRIIGYYNGEFGTYRATGPYDLLGTYFLNQ